MRELTDKERSKAQQGRQQLTASLEAKKRKLKGITSDESGEFRVLADNKSKAMIAEAIGIENFFLLKDFDKFGTYLVVANRQGTKKYFRNKKMEVKKVLGSFAVENQVTANWESTCYQSPLKEWGKNCTLAELRPVTEDEKVRLHELNGEAFSLAKNQNL